MNIMPKMQPEVFSSKIITRFNGGEPVLSAKDIPFAADCIYNAGVTKFNGKYVMAFRDDYEKAPWGGCRHILIGYAESDDGKKWDVRQKPLLTNEMINDSDVLRVYDPRLTVIEGRCYICFAVDTNHGLRGGIAVTDDFDKIEVLSLTAPDNRNMVLFPEKINGKYVRLERPMPIYSRRGKDRFDIWMSDSPDLKYWGNTRLVLGVEDVPFANDKIGPGAPPIKTAKGWLTTFHAVERDDTRGKHGWEEKWTKCYNAGIMLLSPDDPSKVIGMSRLPLIAPETVWETELGMRTNVIFPGGMIAEDNGEVKIYYGASDTVECLATANIDELVSLCLEK